MQNPTHFIEVYNPTKDYKFEGVRNTNQSHCLPIEYLDGDLKYTENCGVFQTVAIFKIKVKN